MKNDDFLDKDSFYSEGGFQVTNAAKSFLATSASWGKFLAIMGFIGTALMILGGIAMMFVGAISNSFSTGTTMNPFGAFGGVGIGLLYLFLAIFYFFPALYLYNFSSKTKSAIRNSDSSELEQAFKNLKSMFLFLGVTTIVFIALYVLGIIFAMIAGASM
ncbi:DUF5362 family protein [Bernardetia sp.]|uniref:DUF5362 family protein n=1 Tax=Bernardetia sp. TaxID=1937974 RepID=UPI0025BC7E9A|nr:DUF5362 family protein [Bernardetia sp.]